jgi:hypothetical protein
MCRLLVIFSLNGLPYSFRKMVLIAENSKPVWSIMFGDGACGVPETIADKLRV